MVGVEEEGGTEDGRLGVGEEISGISYLRTLVAFLRGFGARQKHINRSSYESAGEAAGEGGLETYHWRSL
jgi:hypothetical protein